MVRGSTEPSRSQQTCISEALSPAHRAGTYMYIPTMRTSYMRSLQTLGEISHRKGLSHFLSPDGGRKPRGLHFASDLSD